MEILAQSALFLSLVSFTFGVTALSQDFFNRVFQTFAAACLAISLWSFFFFLGYFRNSTFMYDVHLAMNAWLTAPVLLFLQYWTRTERWRGSRILFTVSLGLSALLSILLLPGLERESLTKRIVFFTPSLILIQILWFMIHDEKMRNLSELPRRSLLYSATVLVLVTCLMDHIPGLWVGISVFGNLALMGFLFFIRHNLLKRQKFLHLDVFLGRFLVLVLVAGLLTTIYSVLVVWVRGDFALFILNAFLLSFFLVNVVPSMTSVMTYFLESFLDARVKALRSSVAETYSDVLRRVGFDEVLERVTVFLESQFEVTACTVLTLDAEKQSFTSLDHRIQYPQHHPAIVDAFPSGKKMPTAFSLGERLEERRRAKLQVPSEVLEFQKTMGNFIVPLVTSEKKWIGILGMRLRGRSEGLDECSAIFRRLADLLMQKQFFDLYRERERLATLGEMAAGLAHEIRNPLGAIKGAVQILEESEGKSSKEEAPLYRVILEETNRLNGFLAQFLEYSKPVPIERDWFRLSAQTEYVVGVAKLSHPDVPVIFEWHGLENAEIDFGKQHFTQVLLNLLRNSFHSIEKSAKAEGEIRIEASESPSGTLLLKLRDNGTGIPEENLPKVFIPFFTTDPSGTGLGLSISKKLMTSYGANIVVRSREREWTEVELQFIAYRKGSA